MWQNVLDIHPYQPLTGILVIFLQCFISTYLLMFNYLARYNYTTINSLDHKSLNNVLHTLVIGNADSFKVLVEFKQTEYSLHWLK